MQDSGVRGAGGGQIITVAEVETTVSHISSTFVA